MVKISRDKGKSWPKAIPIDRKENIQRKSWTAYSDLVLLSPQKIGILYERDDYKEIVFKVVDWMK